MQIFFGEASVKLAAQGVQSQPLIFLALQAEFQPLDEIKTDQSLPSKLLYMGGTSLSNVTPHSSSSFFSFSVSSLSSSKPLPP